MKVGPFNIREVDNIADQFDAMDISYETIIDKELEAQIMAAFQQSGRMNPRHSAGLLDLKIVYFEMSETDFEKVAHFLERYGIVKPSDGSFELGEEN